MGRVCGILIERSGERAKMGAKATRCANSRELRGDLENDTGKWKRKTTVNSEMSFDLDRGIIREGETPDKPS